MPSRRKSCFVPHCNSSSSNKGNKISLFRVPQDVILRILWHQFIGRSDRNMNELDVICEKHFQQSDIVYEWTSANESLQKYARPALKWDASPLYVKPAQFKKTGDKWYIDYLEDGLDETEYNFISLDPAERFLHTNKLPVRILPKPRAPKPSDTVLISLVKTSKVSTASNKRVMSVYDYSEIISRGYQHNL